MATCTDVNYESTGGGFLTFWGKLSNGNWFITDTDDCISEFDVDANEYMDKYLSDDDVDFDFYEYEQEHVIRRYYPTKELINDIKRQIGTEEATIYLDFVLKTYKDDYGKVFYERGENE